MKSKSFSVVGLLLVAAVLGVATGAVLGSRTNDEDDADAMFAEAEATADRLIPLGAEAARPSSGLITAHPQSLAGIPPYPNAVPRRISDATTVMGMPMVVSWFTTPDAPGQVLEHYEHAYFDAGIPIVSHLFGPDTGYVAWLEEEDSDGGLPEGIVHMISAIKNSPQSTETIVLLSASRPQRMLDGSRRAPPGVALPSEATVPQVVELAFEGTARQIVTSRRRGALQQTADEIVGLLEKDGWKVEPVMQGDTMRSFIGRKAGVSQSVSATEVPERGEVSLMYSLERERVVAP